MDFMTLERGHLRPGDVSTASLPLGGMVVDEPIEEAPKTWIDYLTQFQRRILAVPGFDLYHLATHPQVFVYEPATESGVSATLNYDVAAGEDEDVLLDLWLPRLPIKVRQISLRVRSAGRGKPKFKFETEISLDDNE